MAVMAVLITTELVVLSYTIKIFSAVRAYVGGEGLWSKAQKNAAYYLIKYAYSHDEKDYQYYLYYLKVPLSDHQARIALGSNPIDYDAATKGFLGGRIHEDDIPGIIWLFTTFNKISYINKAIIVWGSGDALMEQFLQAGNQMHVLISSQHATPDQIKNQLALIDRLNLQLTDVEDEFSYTLGQASRWLEDVILKLVITTAVTVEFTGMLFTILTGFNLSKRINAMNKVANKIARDDFTERVVVTSKDEIGQLASSFNTMIDSLDTNIKQKYQVESNFKRILEGAPDAMIISDKDGRIVMANTQAEVIFGYPKYEILGKKIEFLIPQRFHTHHITNRSAYFSDPRTRSMGEGLELFGVKKNGDEFPVEISLAPIETEEGMLVLAAIRDVTTNKNIEKLLIDKNVQLINSDMAKDQFLTHMSHELRTPLNGIIVMTQILQAGNLTTEQHEQLDIISESNEQLLAVINQILDFSKIEAGSISVERVDFNLREFISKLLEAYIVRARDKHMDFTCNIASDVPARITGDVVKIRQILANLLDNAVKFTNKGEIKLEISLEDNKFLRFDVKDTGIGIMPDVLPKLFRPFSQGDSSMTRKYGGTGLGLAISKRLVEVLGGSMNVTSSKSGSTFSFTIPCGDNSKAENREQLIKPASPEPVGTIAAKKRILIVEDNKLNQRALTLLLDKFHLAADIVNDGVEALKAMDDCHYDLILMDCQMPNMDGFQTTREIRKREASGGEHIPIIGVTAHAMQANTQKCLDAGMDESISKPYNINELHFLLHKYLDS